jgi:hypothetical protein
MDVGMHMINVDHLLSDENCGDSFVDLKQAQLIKSFCTTHCFTPCNAFLV